MRVLRWSVTVKSSIPSRQYERARAADKSRLLFGKDDFSLVVSAKQPPPVQTCFEGFALA
jgi:hypothetical protein